MMMMTTATMTKKAEVVPGTVIEVLKAPDDWKSRPMFSYKTPFKVFAQWHIGAYYPNPGDHITILTNPKKHDGINLVELSYKGKHCVAYYADVRYMTVKV